MRPISARAAITSAAMAPAAGCGPSREIDDGAGRRRRAAAGFVRIVLQDEGQPARQLLGDLRGGMGLGGAAQVGAGCSQRPAATDERAEAGMGGHAHAGCRFARGESGGQACLRRQHQRQRSRPKAPDQQIGGRRKRLRHKQVQLGTIADQDGDSLIQRTIFDGEERGDGGAVVVATHNAVNRIGRGGDHRAAVQQIERFGLGVNVGKAKNASVHRR